MTSALAVREQPQGGALAMWNEEQLEVIKRLICPDATDTELALFGQVCQRTGLDAFSKQIYGIKRKGKLTIQISIDGFRLTAQRSGDYAGQEGPQWCGEDGVWRDVWLSPRPPAAARVGAYRKGWVKPAWGIATWVEFAQTYNGQPSGQWASMPAHMLAKCAESAALRKAFPAELSGLYGAEEMDQSENTETPYVPVGSAPVAPVEGHVVDDIPEWVSTYHVQWAKAAAKANDIGATIPAKLEDPKASGKAAVQASIRGLVVNIKAKERETLEAQLREVTAIVNDAAGVEYLDIPEDLAEKNDDEVREMIAGAQALIPTETAA